MEEIWDRTRLARENLGIDAKEMPGKFKALDIEITSDAYYKYEKRSPLKQHLIAPFCQITGIRVEWLLTGEGEMLSNRTFDQPDRKLDYHLSEAIGELQKDMSERGKLFKEQLELLRKQMRGQK